MDVDLWRIFVFLLVPLAGIVAAVYLMVVRRRR
jgi:hypothetical protein